MDFNSLENIRKKASTLVGIGIGLLILSIVSFLFIGPFALILFAAGIVLLIVGIAPFNRAKREFKYKYIKPMIEKKYDNARYEPDYGIREQVALSSRIVPRGDRYTTEDLVSGSYDDVNFYSADIHVEEEHTHTDSQGHTTTEWVTIFKGRFFQFEFNKNFKHDLIITERMTNTNKWGLHSVKLESAEFNKKFKTYAKDDHEAFYIITPQIIERLLEIEKKYDGKCSFSFVNNMFYFALNNNKDYFELKLFKKVDETVLLSFEEDINMMKEIIETLKLNVNIFKTED